MTVGDVAAAAAASSSLRLIRYKFNSNCTYTFSEFVLTLLSSYL